MTSYKESELGLVIASDEHLLPLLRCCHVTGGIWSGRWWQLTSWRAVSAVRIRKNDSVSHCSTKLHVHGLKDNCDVFNVF